MKPQGLLQRLIAGFRTSLRGRAPSIAGPTSASPRVRIKTTVKRVYRIRDAASGEIKEFGSLEEVPAQYRDALKNALAKAPAPKSSALSYTGPDGVARTYRSMDEVPAEIRALIASAEKDRDAG